MKDLLLKKLSELPEDILNILVNYGETQNQQRIKLQEANKPICTPSSKHEFVYVNDTHFGERGSRWPYNKITRVGKTERVYKCLKCPLKVKVSSARAIRSYTGGGFAQYQMPVIVQSSYVTAEKNRRW